jgi:hypothetical protein
MYAWGYGLMWFEIENWPRREGKRKRKNYSALFSRACKLIQIQVILKPTLPQEIKQRPMH